jgi:hypothetical protein
MPPFDSPEVLVPLFIIPIVVIVLAKAIKKYRDAYKAKHAADVTKPTN